MASTAKALRVFYSFAHEDEGLRDELNKHLSLLERRGVISGWHDRNISGGLGWQSQIDEHLEQADIVLLLISADFLASDYCYGVEMTRALERDRLGQARVVPVILKPVDWEAAPFASLQALPKDARAVTEWSDSAQAFRDIAKGIRRIAESLNDIRDPAVPQRPLGFASLNSPGRAWIRWPRSVRAAVAALLVTLLLAATAIPWWRAYQTRLMDGWALLNVGRDLEASEAFERARRLNPLGRDAAWGRDLSRSRTAETSAQFEERVRALQRRRPDDPYVELMLGDLAYTSRQPELALRHYALASRKVPGFAEAWFKQGILLDQGGSVGKAEEMFRKSIAIAERTPRYRNNLAWLFAKRGQLDAAVAEYAKNDAYPLSAAEASKVLWAKGDLLAADDMQRKAVKWLKDPAVAERVENRGPWYVEVGGHGIQFDRTSEKLCYVQLAQLTTRFLIGGAQGADGDLGAFESTCSDSQHDAHAAVASDLDWAAGWNAALSPMVQAWTSNRTAGSTATLTAR